jgi:hypothetical protein
VKCAGLNASGIPFSLFVHLLHFFLLFLKFFYKPESWKNMKNCLEFIFKFYFQGLLLGETEKKNIILVECWSYIVHFSERLAAR